MRSPRLRRFAVTLTLIAAPVGGVIATAGPEAAPAPAASNFVCASVGQINFGVCVGPPVRYGAGL